MPDQPMRDAQAYDNQIRAKRYQADPRLPRPDVSGVIIPNVGDSTNPKDLIGVTKPPLDLVPAALDIFAAEAFRDGARKYGPFNWRTNSVKASIYVAAARRHLARWFDGEAVDPDSGVHHLGHAAACLAILLDAESNGNLVDDRPRPGPSSFLIGMFTQERAA